jgi:polysaccharide biosynthesis transport protein
MDTSGKNRHPRPALPESEGIQFAELIKVIMLRRKLLYLFTVMCFLGTIFKQIVYVPFYTAQVTMTVQKAENSPIQMALVNMGTAQWENPDRLKKYQDYINSYEFYLAVAERLKFQDGYHMLKLTSPAEMSITGKKFWLQYLSNHFGHKWDDPSTAAPEPVLVPVERLAGIIQSMAASQLVGNDGIRIFVTTLDSFTSMVLANTAAEVFVRKTGERDYNEVTEVKRFIEEQLQSTTERLKKAESALIEFKRTHNIISIANEQTAYSAKLAELENEVERARIKARENDRLIDFYQKALARTEKSLLTQGSASIRTSQAALLQRLRQQLDNFRQKKVLMQAQGFAEGSWQMSQINEEIDKAAVMLKTELEKPESQGIDQDEPIVNLENARFKLTQLKSENKELDSKIAAIEKSRQTLLKNLGSLPSDEQILLTLTRDVDLQFELYSSLKKKLQEVEIQQVALQSHVRINDRSGMAPPAPRTNFLIKVIFALLIGIFLGCSTAFLLEAVDPTMKHPADLERLELITLGSIPHVHGSQLRSNLGNHSYRPDLLICREKPESAESMAFKHIRAQLTSHRKTEGQGGQIFTVTSPEHGDGKSFVASNLAIALSQLEKRTLLIDSDMRNPSVQWLFGFKDGVGLSSVLSLKSSLDNAILKQRSPNLDILPAGRQPQNPTELLSNEKFRVLLEYLKTIYDFIVIDAPPAAAIVDAAILSSLSDCVILTAAFRKTRKDVMVVALKRILQVSSRHIYAVLNNVWEVDPDSTYDYADGQLPQALQVEPVDSQSELQRFEDEILRQRKAS